MFLKKIMLFIQQEIYLNSCSIMRFLLSKQIQTFTLRTWLWGYLFECTKYNLLHPCSWHIIKSRIKNTSRNFFFLFNKVQIFFKISFIFQFFESNFKLNMKNWFTPRYAFCSSAELGFPCHRGVQTIHSEERL